MRIGTLASCVLAVLIPALPATAATASSTVILLHFTVASLPDGVFIDEDLTGDISTFCLPPIGVGFCLPPDFSNNLGPGINPGGPFNNPGPPYEFSWSGETSFAQAPPGTLSEYGTFNQTDIAFRNTTDIIQVVAVSWNLTYSLETEGVSSRAAISTEIAQQDIPSHIIFDPEHPIWAGDSVTNGASKPGGFMTGTFAVTIGPLSQTSLQVFDPTYAFAATPEPSGFWLGVGCFLALWWRSRRG